MIEIEDQTEFGPVEITVWSEGFCRKSQVLEWITGQKIEAVTDELKYLLTDLRDELARDGKKIL